MVRVGIDVQSRLGQATGIGRYTAGLLEALPQSAPWHDYVTLRPTRDQVMRTDRRLRWQQHGLPRAARHAEVDVLHVTGFDAPLRSPVPVVLTVHDVVGALRPADLPLVSRLYWGHWLPWTIQHADAVISVSETTRREIAAWAGTDGADITVIPPGVDPRFRPIAPTGQAQIRRRHGLDRPYVLFVGTTEPRKGIDTLLAAFTHLSRRHPHHLVIAGPETRPWRTPQGFPRERLHVLGYVADADLPGLYAASDVVVLPSRHEGFGFPVAEAMACGTPVVCSEAGALSETAGGAALHVRAGEPGALARAVGAVLSDRTLASSLRAAGLERARRFDWHRAATQTAEVYRAVSGNRSRRRSAG